jgi:hypothetical protein
MIERWTRWVLHHRKSILAAWIALFVIGGWAASAFLLYVWYAAVRHAPQVKRRKRASRA